MAYDDPTILSRQQAQEHDSCRMIDQALAPWMITWAQQGKDVGEDAWVTIVDRDGSGSLIVSPHTFFVQAKSHSLESANPFLVRVETRKVRRWNENSSPVVVAAFSAKDGRIGYRGISDLVSELDAAHTGWRDQETVGLPFRPAHVLEPDAAKEMLNRLIRDSADRAGGVDEFHRVRRRVLLTDIFLGTVSTAGRLDAKGQDGRQIEVFWGPGWHGDELDVHQVFAPRVISGALLLYEQVLFPLDSLGVLRRVLDERTLVALVDQQRLVPVSDDSFLGFLVEPGRGAGKPVSFSLHGDPVEARKQTFDRVTRSAGAGERLVEVLRQHTRFHEAAVGESIVDETKRDLMRSDLRLQLGLRRDADDTGLEPTWDKNLVNRLLRVNWALAVAERHRLDVVEYEGGLAELATVKWYSAFRLNRLFATQAAFSEILRGAGVPDLGLLEGFMGVDALIQAATSASGQEFRDWFWDALKREGRVGPTREAEVRKRLTEALGNNLEAFKFVLDLKLKFFSAIGGEYPVGNAIGFSTRAAHAGALRRQALFQQKLRMADTRVPLAGRDPYGKCPCGSGEKLRFCCGGKRVR